MRIATASFVLSGMLAAPAFGDVIYNNLNPSNSIGVATRPDSTGAFEIEAGDDFVLSSPSLINSASFIGLISGSTGTVPPVSDVVTEIYRVFPADSNVGRTSGSPTFSTSQVPTRVNSPSDIALTSRDSAASELSYSVTVLDRSFTALNSIQPGGIHPTPNQTTGGNGVITGVEIQIDVTLNSAFNLPADHYFFVPQVSLADGGEFYWLSASRPISGTGTTPFPTGVNDLQAWTRDAALDPDWLRIGTDIVGGTPAPTFNTAFSLAGTAVPEPATIPAVVGGLALIGFLRSKAKAKH